MSNDTQLVQRHSADFIAGGFVALPLGLAIYLLTRDGESTAYMIFGVLIAVVGWVLLGVGLTRLGSKVDDLYRHQVTRSKVRD